MTSKYYLKYTEKRKFYCITISSHGNPIKGWVDTERIEKNTSYKIVKCDFNLVYERILNSYINKVRSQAIFADTEELAESLYKEACKQGKMKVRINKQVCTININLNKKYEQLVKNEVIEDRGGYFLIQMLGRSVLIKALNIKGTVVSIVGDMLQVQFKKPSIGNIEYEYFSKNELKEL